MIYTHDPLLPTGTKRLKPLLQRLQYACLHTRLSPPLSLAHSLTLVLNRNNLRI